MNEAPGAPQSRDPACPAGQVKSRLAHQLMTSDLLGSEVFFCFVGNLFGTNNGSLFAFGCDIARSRSLSGAERGKALHRFSSCDFVFFHQMDTVPESGLQILVTRILLCLFHRDSSCQNTKQILCLTYRSPDDMLE